MKQVAEPTSKFSAARSGPVTPEALVSLLPSSPLYSSEPAGGPEDSYQARTYRQPVSVLHLPPLDHAVLVINRAGPVLVESVFDENPRSRCQARITPDDITLLPPGLPSSWHIGNVTEVLHLHLPAGLYQAAAAGLGRPEAERTRLRPLLGQPDRLARQLGLAVLDEMQQGQPAGRLYCDTLVNTLVVHLLTRYSRPVRPAPSVRAAPPDLPRPALAAALEYIESNLARPVSLDELARLVNLSPYHFVRQFRARLGQAPHQYLIQRRLEQAALLLEKTELPLSCIAAETGFADQAHLGRRFRRVYGLTPGEYRRQRRARVL